MIMMFTIIISENIKAKPYLYEQSKLGCLLYVLLC